MACGDYDRTRALENGTVQPEGIELTCLRLPVEETFFRMMRYHEFDVAEMSLSTYVMSLQQKNPPFVALPAYTSRMFRHSSVYINVNSGITQPADLRNKVVGTPEYQLTAGVWIRGILADEYRVPIDSVTYLTGGLETAGRVEKAVLNMSSSIVVRPIASNRTLSEMLASGEIDAMYTPRVPSPFAAGDPRVSRLWPNVIEEEQNYFSRTGIFPIMHVVVVRRDIYEDHPWIARSLYKALELARQDAEKRLYDSSALRFMLPWLIQHLEEVRGKMGANFWSYGVEANRDVLATFLRYHREQGLSGLPSKPEELFAPECLESFII